MCENIIAVTLNSIVLYT